MRLLWYLPFLFSFSSFSQVNLIVQDETKSGFKLALNGYVQNTEAVQGLMIKNLDTVPYILHMELAPDVHFTKIIHLRENGNHKYIITTNSRDELQLRYRGEIQTPAGIMSMDIQRIVPLKETTPLITASVRNPEVADIPASTEAKKEVIPTTEIVEIPDHIAVIKPTDTVKTKDSAPVAISKKTNTEVATFHTFLEDLKTTEFEFEKIRKSETFAQSHTYSIEELSQVFEVLMYDNSRLQLLQAVMAKIADSENINDLAEYLEYEISKQKLQNMINP